jgi:hypothetical protein
MGILMFFLNFFICSDILLQLLTWAELYVIKSGTEHVQVAVITPNNSSSALKSDKSNKENINKVNDTTTSTTEATGMYICIQRCIYMYIYIYKYIFIYIYIYI